MQNSSTSWPCSFTNRTTTWNRRSPTERASMPHCWRSRATWPQRLDIGPLLGTIPTTQIDYRIRRGVHPTLGGTDLEVLAYRGPIPSVQALTVRFPLNVAKANNE